METTQLMSPNIQRKNFGCVSLLCNSVVEENIGSRQRDGHAMDQTSFVSCVIRGTVGVVLALDQYMKFRGESEPGIHRFEISEC